MWTIYDVYHDRYWNDHRQCWGTVDEATGYTREERNHLRLRSVAFQWRFVEAYQMHLHDGALCCCW